MRCEEARLRISREVDGELSSEERDAVRGHVEKCAECARFARQCREMQRLVSESSVPVPDRPYWEGLLTRVEKAAAPEPGRNVVPLRRSRILAYAAAAACVVLLVGLALQQGRMAGLREELERARASGAESAAGDYDLRQMSRFVKGVPLGALAEQAEVFVVLDDYLQGGLRWVVQDGRQTELGMSGDAFAAGAAASGKPMLVEIQLVRAAGNGDVQVVSAPTLMIVPGEEANFHLAASDGIGGKRFRYRCAAFESPTGGAYVEVALELMPEGAWAPINLSGVFSFSNGDRVPAAYSRAGEVSYLLLVSTRQPDEGSRGDTSL